MIDGNSVAERVGAFHKRHGGVCVTDGAMWYYPNGARRDCHPLGVLAEPPDDSTRDGAFRKAENIVTYHRLKLKSAAGAFNELNFRLSTALPPNPKKAIAELKRLQAVVDECKRELADAEAKRDSTEVAKHRKQIKEARDAERDAFAKFQHERRSIRI